MDYQSGVGHFFEQLRIWREESEKEFANFMQSHSGSISNTINDLVKEVSDLKMELSLIKIERNELLGIVHKPSNDIRQRSEELADPQPLLEIERIPDKVTQEKYAKISTINSETGDPDNINFNGTADFTEENHCQDENVGKKNRKEMDINLTPTKSLHNESKISNSTVDENSHVCPEGNFPITTSKKLGINLENVHPELELIKNRESIQEKGDKMFKYEQCPYESVNSGHSEKNTLTKHIKAMHENISNHVCGECGNAFVQKGHLKQHIKVVHKNIRDHICEQGGKPT